VLLAQLQYQITCTSAGLLKSAPDQVEHLVVRRTHAQIHVDGVPPRRDLDRPPDHPVIDLPDRPELFRGQYELAGGDQPLPIDHPREQLVAQCHPADDVDYPLRVQDEEVPSQGLSDPARPLERSLYPTPWRRVTEIDHGEGSPQGPNPHNVTNYWTNVGGNY
jgi:hypothetical protein